MVPAYIAFGSNMGDRNKNIEKAIQYLRELDGVSVKNLSSIYETDPVGGSPHLGAEQPASEHLGARQGKFLNGVLEIETVLLPDELLDRLKGIESRLGRVKTEENGPRPIDLDILFYSDFVISGSRLKIPHPKSHEREFVLKGMVEIAPDFMHPRLNKTVKQLYGELNPAPSTEGAGSKQEGLGEGNKNSALDTAGEQSLQAAG